MGDLPIKRTFTFSCICNGPATDVDYLTLPQEKLESVVLDIRRMMDVDKYPVPTSVIFNELEWDGKKLMAEYKRRGTVN